MTATRNLCFLVTFCAYLFGVTKTQDDSLAGSFLSGLLDTITSTADSKDCPGVCIHTIATLICYDVLENVACPSPMMRCCIEPPSTNTTSSVQLSNKINSSVSVTEKYSGSMTVLPVQNKTEESTETKHNNKKETSLKTCPGVCVAEKISDYCEAYIMAEDLCKPGLRCCVSSDAYGDKSPYNLIIPNKSINRTTASKPQVTTEHVYKSVTKTTAKPNKSCPGECVSGLFALFCDDINTEVPCPGEATCCITSSSMEEVIPTTTVTTVLTTQRPHVTENEPRCPGFCLLNIMAAFCERPSILIPHTSNCKRGSVCCDNTRNVASKPKPRPKPISSLQTTVVPTTFKATIDKRSECPGSCIVSYLSFTCFTFNINIH